MTSSLVSAVFLLISSMLAFWAYSWVKSQAEVFEAESSSFDSTLANAKMVSLGAGFHLSAWKRDSLLDLQVSDSSSSPLLSAVECSTLSPAGRLRNLVASASLFSPSSLSSSCWSLGK